MAATQSRRIPVQFTPRALELYCVALSMLLSFYDNVCSMRTMYVAKREKAAPAAERRMLLAARAEAALRMDLAFITIFYRSEIVGRKRHGDLRDEIGVDDVIHALQEDTE